MPCFYLSEALSAGKAVSSPDNVVRHLHMLRLKLDRKIVLFNGDDKTYPARLGVLERRRATTETLREEEADNESSLNIILVQAVSSGERTGFTLQKSVELGVDEIRPVFSERYVVRSNGERAARRVARWQEIVAPACEQSGRNTVPQVLPLVSYQEVLRQMPSEKTKLLMSVRNVQKPNQITPSLDGPIFMVGPERSWMGSEEQQTFGADFQVVTLGSRVLQAETASLAAIAAMQTLWGDFV